MKKMIVAALAAMLMMTGLSASDFECGLYAKNMASQSTTINFKVKNDMPVMKYEIKSLKNNIASVHGHCQGKTKYQKASITYADAIMNYINAVFKK